MAELKKFYDYKHLPRKVQKLIVEKNRDFFIKPENDSFLREGKPFYHNILEYYKSNGVKVTQLDLYSDEIEVDLQEEYDEDGDVDYIPDPEEDWFFVAEKFITHSIYDKSSSYLELKDHKKHYDFYWLSQTGFLMKDVRKYTKFIGKIILRDIKAKRKFLVSRKFINAQLRSSNYVFDDRGYNDKFNF